MINHEPCCQQHADGHGISVIFLELAAIWRRMSGAAPPQNIATDLASLAACVQEQDIPLGAQKAILDAIDTLKKNVRSTP